MKMYTFAACVLLAAEPVHAQEKADSSLHCHEIKIAYSDGLILGGMNVWETGLLDAVTGVKRSNLELTGVFGLGYRYGLNKKFKIGIDTGLATVTSEVTSTSDKTPSIKLKDLYLLLCPTVDLVYSKRKIWQFYGSASLGPIFSRHYETGLTVRGKELVQHDSKFETAFAYQINPIGLRAGNSRIGGFVEAGLGYKGFATIGLSLGF